jgi:hypothetical protein
MKILNSFFLVSFLFSVSCHMTNVNHDKKLNDSSTVSNSTAVSQPLPEEIITGDFNGDGKKEQAWVEKPLFNQDSTDCNGACITVIHFSDTTIPAIEISKAISAEISNLHNLNKQPADEIGVLPGSFAGCWNDYHVYSLSGNQWIEAVKPFPVHCNQWEEGIPPVKADSLRTGYVFISYSKHTGKGIETKTKSVPVH